MSDEYAFWQAALSGKNPDHTRGRAESGIYRMRQRDGNIVPVRIWRDQNRLCAKIGSGKGKFVEDEEAFCEQVFSYCLKNPVTKSAYMVYTESGRWPEDLPDVREEVAARMGDNAPQDVVLAETVVELRREAEKWLKEIGGEITTQEQVDKAGNFADRFGELEKEATTSHTVEKAPVLKAQREVDGKWQPVIRSAKDNKRWAKDLTTAFLRAEQQRKAQAAAEKAARGETIRPDDIKVKAGTRGRGVSLRTTKDLKVDSLDTLWKHYEQDIRFRLHPEVQKVLQRVAEIDLTAGKEVPGAHLEDVHTAA